MKPIHLASAFLVGLLVTACGDDSAGPSSSASTGGSTSVGTGGAPATSGSVSSSDGSGGEAVGSTSSTGGGGAAPSAIGGPCLEDGDCAEGLCLTEGLSGDPSGFCTRRCDPSVPDQDCPEGVCENRTFGLVCIPSCDPDAPACRDAYQCRPAGLTSTDWACRYDCDGPEDCPTTQNCVTYPTGGRCIFPESECDDLKDEDQDRAVDCSDSHCSDDPICAGGPGALGDPCDSHLDCNAGTFCIDEPRAGWPGGMCVGGRGADGTCPEGQYPFTKYTLAPDVYDVSGCLPACASDDECRDGYQCQAWCQPRCTADDQCASGNCRENFDWLCSPPEICDDGINNDGQFDTDCYDPACVTVCADAFAASCAAAAPLQASGTFTSSAGQQSQCSGPGAALDFYTYTMPSSGQLLVRLEAATPHYLGLYLDDCDPDPWQCRDNFTPFTDGIEEAGLSGGSPGKVVLVSVAAGSAADVGPYTLEYTFTP